MSNRAFSWLKTFAATGVVAAAACLVYYAFKDDEDVADQGEEEDLYKKEDGSHSGLSSSKVDRMTRQDCLELLSKIIISQEQTKKLMSGLVSGLLDGTCEETLEAVYELTKPDLPPDPLEAKGLSLFDLDYLVDRFQNDSTVRETIMKIMNMPLTDDLDDVELSCDEILEIHEFMLSELETMVAYYRTMPDRELFDKKSLTVAMQALISAKVQRRYGISHGKIDRAVIRNHSELTMNNKFSRLTMQMQTQMAEITG